MATQGKIIPVVDLGGLFDHSKQQDVERTKVISQLKKASKEVGFFYLINHGVSPDLMQSTFKSMRAFMDQPEEIKMKVHVNHNEGLRGYSAEFEQGNYGVDVTDIRNQLTKETTSEAEDEPMDFKQTYHYGRELPKTHKHYNVTLFAPNVYPDTPAQFSEDIKTYWGAMDTLSDTLFEVFAEALNLPRDYFEDKVDEGMDSMNMNYYLPFADRPQNQMGIGAHTDYECFTLLAQDGPTALQIFSPEKQEWVYVPEVRNAIVVNIGDMMARWSNDEFTSTVHRVIPPSKPRASIAYFRCCNFDTQIKCLTTEKAKYPPIAAGEHMLARIGTASQGLDFGAAE